MSLATIQVPRVLVLDPRVAVNAPRTFAILKGGQKVLYQKFDAPSVSTNGISITGNTPGPTSIVSRKIYNRWFVNLAFTGTGNPLLQLGTNDGFRAYPISSVINNLQLSLNSYNFNTNLNFYIGALLHYWNPVFQQDYDLSMTPSQLDQYQRPNDWTVYGSARNPLALYGENSTQITRGGFVYDSVTNGNGTANIRATLTEPLLLSPLAYGTGEQSGLIGIQNFDLTITTGYGSLSDLTYMWQHNPAGTTISSVAGTFYGVPQMLFTFLQGAENQLVPPMVSYPYFRIQAIPQTGSTLAPGAETTTSINNFQLSDVPNMIYVWVKKSRATATINDCDSFANITKLNIIYDGQSGLLASATEQDLYQMSLRNGNNQSFPQWIQYQGSVASFNPTTDFGSPADQAASVKGSKNLQIDVTYNNPNTADTITYEIWLGIISEGVAQVINQVVDSKVGVLAPIDVLQAPLGNIDINQIRHIQRLSGGNFFGDIGQFFRDLPGNIKKGVETVAPYVEKAIDVGKKIAPLLPLVGLGKPKRKATRRGGAMISRQDLLDNQE